MSEYTVTAPSLLVWSNASSVAVFVTVDGARLPFPVPSGASGSVELPPGEYEIYVRSSSCGGGDSYALLPVGSGGEAGLAEELLERFALQIETSFAQVGCTADDAGNVAGLVYTCKTVAEDGSETPTFKLVYVAVGGSEFSDYDADVHGPWEMCTPDAPAVVPPVTGWSTGDGVNSLPDAHCVSVSNPTCHAVILTTSAGDIYVPARSSATESFDTPVSITAMAFVPDPTLSPSSLADVRVQATKK